MKPSAVPNSDKLDPGVIICSLGARYSSYCANVSRTYFIDPVDKHTKAYKAVLEAYDAAMTKMVPGATLGSVYDFVRTQLAESDDELARGMMRNIGFGIG